MPLFSYNPLVLLEAYAKGLFPTLNDQGNFFLYKPQSRALLPLAGINVCKGLKQAINKNTFTVRFNTDFDAVVRSCERTTENWITPELRRVYGALHRQGWAHSVECYSAQNELVGGLYGVAVGGVFFSESSFSRESQASKMADYALVELCRTQGFRMIDVQLMSDHLASLGAFEVTDDRFQLDLYEAVRIKTDWGSSLQELRKKVFPPALAGERILIRALVQADAEALFEMNQDPSYHQHIYTNPIRSLEQAKQQIRLATNERYPAGIPDPLGICFKDAPSTIIGTVGGFILYAGLPQMEFVYDLNPKVWGKGLAPEAGKLLRDYLFLNYPVRRLQGRAATENKASCRVLEKLGFTFEGTLREVMYYADRTWDMKYFSLTFDDWQKMTVV